MKAINEAKAALKKYISENKEKVASDLGNMRKQSKGYDIFRYVDSVSSSFSFIDISILTENEFDPVFIEPEIYNLKQENFWYQDYKIKAKKDSEILSGSFF